MHFIRASVKVATSVKFISLNHSSSMTTIFLRNNLTVSLDVWSDFFPIMFHKISYITHNLLNVCN